MDGVCYMKRIVHVMSSFGCGGLEKVVLNILSHSHLQYKHTVISLSSDVVMAETLPSDVELIIIDKKDGKDLGFHLKLFKQFSLLKPDIVTTYNFGCLEYQFVARLSGCKHCVHIDHGHGGDRSEGKDFVKRKFRRLMSVFLNQYIVVSDDLKDFVTNIVGVPARKVHLIRNGIRIDGGRHQPANASGSGLSLMTVGRLVEVKNQQALIRMAHEWNVKNPGKKAVHVHLVGDGELRGELEGLAQRIGAFETTHFHGQTMTPWSYANQSDAFIMTSLYEAMPMAILESMSIACPVMCSKVGGIGDFLSNNEAVLFEGKSDSALYDAIDAFYHMPDHERQKLGLSGFNFVLQKYSQEKMVSDYLQVWG